MQDKSPELKKRVKRPRIKRPVFSLRNDNDSNSNDNNNNNKFFKK